MTGNEDLSVRKGGAIMAEPSTDRRCPLCGGPNDCGAAIDPGACWCQSATFSPQLLARLDESQKGTACICPRCVAAALTAAEHTKRSTNGR